MTVPPHPSYGPPKRMYEPPAGLPPNMLPPHHQHPRPPQHAPRPPMPAQPPAPAPRPRNTEAIASASTAAAGVISALLGVPLLVGVFGLAALVLGILGNRRAVKGAPRGKLALLGLLVGILEVVALFAGAASTGGTDQPASASAPAVSTSAAAAQPPAGPATSVDDGTYQVGTDIAAGRYKTPGPDADSVIKACYWARTRDDSGDFAAIIANGNAAGPGSVTIKQGEFFTASGGCTWTKTG